MCWHLILLFFVAQKTTFILKFKKESLIQLKFLFKHFCQRRIPIIRLSALVLELFCVRIRMRHQARQLPYVAYTAVITNARVGYISWRTCHGKAENIVVSAITEVNWSTADIFHIAQISCQQQPEKKVDSASQSDKYWNSLMFSNQFVDKFRPLSFNNIPSVCKNNCWTFM